MAAGKRKQAAKDENEATVPAAEKIARLLALLLVRDIKKKTEQVPLLRSAGFDVADVAHLLGMDEGHVRVADYQGRKKRRAG